MQISTEELGNSAFSEKNLLNVKTVLISTVFFLKDWFTALIRAVQGFLIKDKRSETPRESNEFSETSSMFFFYILADFDLIVQFLVSIVISQSVAISCKI